MNLVSCYLMSPLTASPQNTKTDRRLTSRSQDSRKNNCDFFPPFRPNRPIVERVLLFSEEYTITGSYDRADWEHHPDIQQSFSTC